MVEQNLRALKALGHEPSSAIITSFLQLKLDPTTMFEWQKCSQSHTDIPHCDEFLQFIDLRAQASESTEPKRNTLLTQLHPPSQAHLRISLVIVLRVALASILFTVQGHVS